MADTIMKHITLDQSKDIANAVLKKVKDKNYAVAATTIAGYGITDAYTKTEVDNAIGEARAAVLKPGGSLAASGVVSSLLIEGNLGKVYNLTEDITTTSDFVEGSGKKITAGTNIYIVDTDTTGSNPTYKFDVLAGEYGVATQDANGLMSSTDKTKLDNADVTAYTGSGAIDITNHVVSIAAASPSTSGSGGNAGTMSATDKEKLDSADVTAYTSGNGIDITNHAVSVKIDNSNARGLSVGNDGLALAAVTPDTWGGVAATGTYVSGTIYYTSAACTTKVDTTEFVAGETDVSSYYVLAKTNDGTDGAMTSADKFKLNNITVATDAEVSAMVATLDNL